MLTDRRQLVLASLIEEYVARALPVGSRTLTERYQLGVSAATVRNELSALEDEGLISQPHTSAGRIPTDSGYRAFVDRLVETGSIDNEEARQSAVDALRSSASELDDLLARTNSALARFTDCLSIVVAPTAQSIVVKQVTVISLNEYRAVVVIVTADGSVFNRHVDFSEPVSADDLADAQRVANGLLAGCDSRLIFASRLVEGGVVSPVARIVIDEVVDCLREQGFGKSMSSGMSSLLRKPEFKDSSTLVPIISALEDDSLLMQIIDAPAVDTAVPAVHIGAENGSDDLSGVSVVAHKYGRGDAAGIVAVIGPTRMDYSKVINAVRIASAALQED